MTELPTSEKSIFLEALEKTSAHERAQFLDRACQDNPQLRAKVEALLHAHQEPQALLDVPEEAAPTLDLPAVTERPGTVIGPYKLLQQIGEGGMGTVFMAEQTQPVRRKVALKVIKAGMDTRHVIARFDAERQALAMMDHLNIARVLDVGATETGRPYFVMELVHGVPITKYCDDNHLTPRERLELFVPVCQAIQHAHQKGIIHRDIKPTNILVTLYDGKPVPKVIDFGVAKATEQPLTEQTLFTQYGTMVGTFEYMSPEQAEMSALGVDTRSDVFSLGVLLYELLTGSTPLTRKRLKEAAYAEVLRLICEEEAPKPSMRLSSSDTLPAIAAARKTEPAKLARLIRGELDWIVLKALEKDRTRRYETASGFAADVLHYLGDEPVQACPPSAGYRLRKFARRNKGALITAILLTAALLVAVVGLAISNNLISREREEAVRQRDDAQEQRRMARRAVDKMFTQVADKWLAHRPSLEPLQREFLEEALHFYQEFAEEQDTNPEVRLETAHAYLRVGYIQNGLAEDAKAEQAYNRAFALLEQLVAEFPSEARYRHALARCHQTFAFVLIETGRESDAVRTERRATQLRKELVAEFPDVPTYRRELGENLGSLAIILSWAGQNREAAEVCRTALPLFENLPADIAKSSDCRWNVCNTVENLGAALTAAGQKQEAEQWCSQAVTLYEKLVADFPYEPLYQSDLSLAHWELARCIKDIRPQEAERAYRTALATAEKVMANSPAVPRYQDLAGDFFGGLVEFLQKTGRPQEAVEAYKQAINFYQKLAAANPKVADYRDQLGQLYSSSGQWEKAIVGYTQAIELKQAALKLSPEDRRLQRQLGNHYQALAQALVKSGEHGRAKEAYDKALNIKENYTANFPADVSARRELAFVYRDRALFLENNLNSRKEAEQRHRQSLAVFEKLAADFPNDAQYFEQVGHAQRYLGFLGMSTGRHAEAASSFQSAVTVFAKLAATHPEVPGHRRFLGHTYRVLGVSLRDAKRPLEAEQAFRQALAIYEKLVADIPEDTNSRQGLSECYAGLALLYTSIGQMPEAEKACRKLMEIESKNARACNNLAWLWATCSDAKMRNPGRAVELAKKAVEVAPKEGSNWNTLGVAYYRAGDWKAAIEALNKSEELLKGKLLSFNAFFLAMAHWQLGNKEEARKQYDQAMEWMEKNKPQMEKNKPQNEELKRFRAEAEELLKIEKK